MHSVAVIDYGMGNLRSVSKALEHVAGDGVRVEVTSDSATVMEADRIVFPGQGAMRDCIAELERFGLREVVETVIYTRPFLGICMGLQALLESSDEDPDTRALGTFSGRVERFPENMTGSDGARLKIPHMGWNNVEQTLDHPLWQHISSGERFYFVHSYVVVPEDQTRVAARCNFGIDFACALANHNLFAVQFHPEKSQHAGLQLLRNFMSWRG